MNTVFADDYDFNAEDATDALQKAIDDETADKIIVENKGTPWIISEQIDLKDNKEIVFEEGVVVRAKSGSFLDNRSSLFSARNVDNIKLIGQGEGENRATLRMNESEYVGSAAPNQFNHAINLLGVDGYEVSGLTLTGAGGDGIHIAGGTFKTPPALDSDILPYSEDGLIENVISDGNRRQGMSIDSAKNLVVRNSTFSNTEGVEPSAGIDLEPTWDFESLQNVTIEDVTIDNNDGGGILVPIGTLDNESAPVSVNIRNVDFKNIVPGSPAIFITRKYFYDPTGRDPAEAPYVGVADSSLPSSMVDGTINVENITISNAEAIANISNPDDNPRNYIFVEDISGSQDDPNNLQVNFNNIEINDPIDKSVNTAPIYIAGLPGEDKPSEIGNLSFNNVTIRGNYNFPVVFAQLGNDDARFNNISGDITVFNSGDGAISSIDLKPPGENYSLTVTDGNTSVNPTTGSVELVNPNFKDGLSGWVVWSEDISIVERSNGNSWVKIDSSPTGGIAQDITDKITPGEDYQISATAQLEELGTYAAIGINYKNEANELQEFQNIDVKSDTPQNIELGFTAPENFASAEIFAYKQEGSALFVDDFLLTEQV